MIELIDMASAASKRRGEACQRDGHRQHVVAERDQRNSRGCAGSPAAPPRWHRPPGQGPARSAPCRWRPAPRPAPRRARPRHGPAPAPPCRSARRPPSAPWRPRRDSAPTMSALPVGLTPACHSVMPSSAARWPTAACRSPESRITACPLREARRQHCAAPGRSRSLKVMRQGASPLDPRTSLRVARPRPARQPPASRARPSRTHPPVPAGPRCPCPGSRGHRSRAAGATSRQRPPPAPAPAGARMPAPGRGATGRRSAGRSRRSRGSRLRPSSACRSCRRPPCPPRPAVPARCRP